MVIELQSFKSAVNNAQIISEIAMSWKPSHVPPKGIWFQANLGLVLT